MSPRALPPLALLALLGSACAPDSLPTFGERVWSGEHVDVWATTDATICAGSYAALDRHAQLLTQEAESLEVSAQDERYRYQWLAKDEYLESGICPEGANACFYGESNPPSVFAFGFSVHEVTHAEFAYGHHSFVDEGLAVMFGDAVLERDETEGNPPVPDVVDETAGNKLESARYRQAGSFIRAVEELYPGEYLSALLETDAADSFDQLEREVAQSGVELSAAIELYSSRESCFVHSTRVALSECATPPTAWLGEQWRATGSVDCDAADTMGPSPEGTKRWTVRSVDVAEAGRYTGRFETDSSLLATMVYCDAGWCESGLLGNSNMHVFLPNVHALLELEVGRYWFRVEQKMDDPEPGAFELTLEPGW